jgi:CubicO group peptidase (beta-lactamase class C family)
MSVVRLLKPSRSLALLTIALTCIAPLSAAEPAPADAVAARIARIESGLLPPARIVGVAAEPWTISSRLTAHKVPAVSIAVLNDGQIEWARAYGVARRGEATAVTPDTLFQAASLSKPVAAVAALALVDRGQLALDTDVNGKLTSWKIPPVPESARVGGELVTLRRLLSHTAGFAVPDFGGYTADAPRPTLPQILDGTPPSNSPPLRLTSTPGARWQYSGGGYCIVQQLLLDVAHQPFAELARERVLTPAGMTASTFEQPLPAARLAQAAAGHLASGVRIPGDAHVYPEQAAVGLWSTPGDLARFALALQQSLTGQPNALLSRATAEAMIAPPLAGSDYGLGIGALGRGDALQLAHSGSSAGFRCSFVFYPRTGRGAVIMTNSNNGGALIPEILRAIAREYAWPDYQIVEKTAVALAAPQFDRFAGRYEREETVLVFSRTGNQFFVRVDSQPAREIFPSSDHEFFFLNGGDTFSFALNDRGRVSHLIRHAPGPQIFQPVRRGP